ncbi:Panacea domain-containing protein [Priestia koreensis]|uniref:Panacea domain-containing protein n=1 Tax=Priestia koreensis TaxID=284581 RepID=UPI002040B222|nr:type II toxin-antitoxin system antitoxin SocA domain-containing protein [Priestia koreensis]MCM3002921.1 DUF4065 domain-containing protein [Priestia koreensis]
MKKTTIFDVAQYFLYLSSPGTSRGITPLKLQKLTFYAQALSYSINKRELFDEDFQAWVHGPVSPDLYYKYKDYGSKEINNRVEKPKFLPSDELVIKVVWNMFGTKDGKYLENKTHNEKPWQEARTGLNYFDHSNNKISKEKIKKYYSKKFIVNREVAK